MEKFLRWFIPFLCCGVCYSIGVWTEWAINRIEPAPTACKCAPCKCCPACPGK